MKHYKNDATQNIFCGFKSFKAAFLKKMKGNFKMECYFKLNNWNASLTKISKGST